MHRVKAHSSEVAAKGDPYVESKRSELARLKIDVAILDARAAKVRLEESMPGTSKSSPDPPKSTTPTMQEMMFCDWIEAKTRALKDGTAAGSNPATAEIRDLRARLDDRRDRELEDLRAEMRSRPAATSSSEKVELSRLVAETVDRVGDRISAKFDPVIGWIFKNEQQLPPAELGSPEASGGNFARELKRLHPEWVTEK